MEVVLKKIKITNSIIKQMYELPFEMFNDNLDVLGYVNPSCYKTINKLAIIYHCDKKECYQLNMHWQKRSTYLGYNGNFSGEMFKKVSNIDEWFENYSKIVECAENAGHLYI
jgi:hypothetical protein